MSNEVDLSIFKPYATDGLKRMGGMYDGGYVVHYPSLLQADCMVSYGVGYDVTFETEFHQVTGKPVYAFDPTMTKLGYLKEGFISGKYADTLKRAAKLLMWQTKQKELETHQIHFVPEGLGDTNTPDFKTIGYHYSKFNLHHKKLLLKIDIEGAEYKVMNDDSFYPHLDNVVQLLFEFHWLDTRLEKLMQMFKKIERTHSLIHIHANNYGTTFDYRGKHVPQVIEGAFLHNSFLKEKKRSEQSYPISGLDFPCDKRKEDISLNFF